MEAHAKDEWQIGSKIQVDQPKLLQDRIDIVTTMMHTHTIKLDIPIYIDILPTTGLTRCNKDRDDTNDDQNDHKNESIQLDSFNDPIGYNLFNHHYSAWPLRSYIIFKEKLHFISEPTNNGHFIPGQVVDVIHAILNDPNCEKI